MKHLGTGWLLIMYSAISKGKARDYMVGISADIFETNFYEFVHVHGSNRVLPNGST